MNIEAAKMNFHDLIKAAALEFARANAIVMPGHGRGQTKLGYFAQESYNENWGNE